MKIVIQRVKHASVSIGDEKISGIGKGLMVLVGVARDDTEADAVYLAAKTAAMRIFPDEAGVMNRSVVDAEGEVLSVSQFTLMASTRKGNRPSYIDAAGHELATHLYDLYSREVERLVGREVRKGVFGADMAVELINDGPVTIIVDSHNK